MTGELPAIAMAVAARGDRPSYLTTSASSLLNHSYMACTGLPNPQADHAVRMVKFARDSMARMGRLTEELSVSLGSDTKELMMRVGLHSGPVTAGVLRGDKGRFQVCVWYGVPG